MNKSIRIFIADDNRLLREGLASMLAELAGERVSESSVKLTPREVLR